MNRKAIIESINELRGEIEKELIANRSGNLAENYERGIKLCNEMVSRVSDETLATTAESLLAKFSRYAIDSLPWSGEIMQKYSNSQKIIESEYRAK